MVQQYRNLCNLRTDCCAEPFFPSHTVKSFFLQVKDLALTPEQRADGQANTFYILINKCAEID